MAVGKQESRTHFRRRTIVQVMRIANWAIMIVIVVFVVYQFCIAADSNAAWEYRMAIRGIGSTSVISAFLRLASDSNMLQALFGGCFMCLWWLWCKRFRSRWC